MRTLINGKHLIENISGIRSIILSSRLVPYTDVMEDSYQMNQLFERVLHKFELASTKLFFLPDEKINNILKQWKSFSESCSDGDVSLHRQQFKVLWNDTRNFLKSILYDPRIQEIVPKGTVRKRAAEDVKEDLQKLGERRESILVQIEQEKSKGEAANQELLDALQELLNGEDLQIQEKRQEEESAKKEEQTESNWDKRIETAFEQLKACTQPVEDEKKKAEREYNIYCNCLVGVAVAVILWLIALYVAIFVCKISFTDWETFIPYYLPIPVFVAFLWVLIVQKNRSNKLSIIMSEELFRIRYLEGLLLSVNKLSKNSDVAIIRINKAIDSMVESFMHQTERTFMSEEKINAVEKKELSANKLMEWTDKLIDKV